jgi:GMP synthase-like glutamine amidotransferase
VTSARPNREWGRSDDSGIERFNSAVVFVVTEHPDYLSRELRQLNRTIARRLAYVSKARVTTVHFHQVASLAGARAVVLSGESAPWVAQDPQRIRQLGQAVLDYNGPVLGLCGGLQLQAMFLGGVVQHMNHDEEKGFREITVHEADSLFDGVSRRPIMYEHHTDHVAIAPKEFSILASNRACRVQAVRVRERSWWGTQFHPELWSRDHPEGKRVLQNFFRNMK